MKNILIVVLSVVCVILLGLKLFSSPPDTISQGDYSNVKIRIARQYSISYAPVYVAEKMGLIEKYIPGATVEWVTISGGAAITEALISGHLDVGFVGIPPAMIAWDKGADLKIVSGIVVPTYNLMVKNPDIKSLADFNPGDKIAVPGIGSIQHMLLSIAAEKYLGDARALDTNVVAMPNPDAFTSLLSGTDITAHLSITPFNEMERRSGLNSILSTGDESLICVAGGKFHNSSPTAYAALVMALNEAITLINQRDPRVLDIIAEVEKISNEDVLTYLNWDGTNYTTSLYGIMRFAEYMKKAGYISKAPEMKDIMWESAIGMVGMRIGGRSSAENALY